MTLQSTLTLTALIYGIAIFISFLVALLIKGLYYFMSLIERRQQQSIDEPAITSVSTEEFSPELIAAISAAVTVAIGKKTHVKSIQYRATRPTAGWSMQGRMTVMSSHSVKR